MRNYIVFYMLCLHLFPIEIGLAEIGDFALSRNNAVFLGEMQFNVSRITHKDFLLPYVPGISAGVDGSESAGIGSPDTRARTVRCGINQFLFDGGKRRRQLKNQVKQQVLTEEEIRRSKINISLSAVLAYLDVLLAGESMRVRKEFLRTITREKSIQKTKLGLGQILEIDYLEMVSREKEAEIQVMQQENIYSNSLIALKTVCQLSAAAPLVLKETLSKSLRYLPPDFNEEEMRRLYLHRSLEYASARLGLENARLAASDLRRKSIPELSLNGSFSISDSHFTDAQYLPRTKNWGITLNMSMDLGNAKYTGRQNYSHDNNGNMISANSQNDVGFGEPGSSVRTVKAARIAVQIAENSLQTGAIQIQNTFDTVVADIKIAYKTLNVRKMKLSIDKNRLEIIKWRHRTGEVPLNQYLEKMLECIESELVYYQDSIAYMQKIYSFERDIGRVPGALGIILIGEQFHD